MALIGNAESRQELPAVVFEMLLQYF